MAALHEFWDISDQTFRTMLEARYRPLVRDELQRHEHDLRLAGDGLINPADVTLNRAVTIAAPASRVWPWLAQMMRSAGMFGWPAVESAGCRSADRLIETVPQPRVGDTLDDLLILKHIDEGREIVWHCPRPICILDHEVREFSLNYLLTPLGPGECRLMSRVRGGYNNVTSQVGRYMLEIIEFVLPAHQLVTIKSHAERRPRHRSNGQARANGSANHQAMEFIPASACRVMYPAPALRPNKDTDHEH